MSTNHPRDESLELMSGNSDEAVNFPLYESYVDSAVASLRAAYLEESQNLEHRAKTSNFELIASLSSIQDNLVGTVEHFLNTTITITLEDNQRLREQALSARDNTVRTLASACEASLNELRRSHESLLDAVVSRFDAELEGHQGRMTRRFLEVSSHVFSACIYVFKPFRCLVWLLLQARDTLGEKLAHMRLAKENDLRDKCAGFKKLKLI